MAENASMRRVIIVLVAAAALTLGGCAAKQPKPAPPAPGETSEPAQGAGAGTASAAAANPDDEGMGPQAGLLATRLVYFDFDSAEIKGAGTDVVAAHPATRVRLEGHTDERGSREYNIGLGERRAQSVRRALLLQGATDTQISTVSYGEERPAAPGHDEAAWAKNRRVEIVYLTQPLPAKP